MNMREITFKSVEQQQLHNREIQRFKYQYSYSVSAIVAPSGSLPVILNIETDADFMVEKITGTVLGPVDSNGLYDQAGLTDFPQPGTGGAAPTFAGSGLTLQIVDQGAGRDLTNGFIPIENLLTPGYDVGMFLPYPYHYFARRNSNIRFDFRNRDTQGSQSADITLTGYKFQMPEIPDTLEQPSSVMGNASPVASN
jgi:hypothetical protein